MEQVYIETARMLKAISDPKRLRIVDMLSCGELCACVILESFSISQPTLSHDMGVLAKADIVRERKDGKNIYYRLDNDALSRMHHLLGQIFKEKSNCICRRHTEMQRGACMAGRNSEIYEAVRKYYSAATKEKGGRLSSSVCCCSAEAVPKALKEIISELPGEIVTKYYGCGSPIPDKVEGCTVLDLGCGTGRDVYVISKLVGALGTVIGLDMNEDQLEVAERYKAEITRKWGFSNVVFKKGYMEDLAAVGIEDGSIDVVISNCVINLSPDKQSVFSEIHRVLKDGGVLFFSDVFSDRKVPEEIRANPLLLGECLGGAMCPEEFDEVMKSSGLGNYEIISSVETPIGNKEIESLIGGVKYRSKTIRAVKGGESGCCRIATIYAEKSSCCCGATRLS